MKKVSNFNKYKFNDFWNFIRNQIPMKVLDLFGYPQIICYHGIILPLSNKPSLIECSFVTE